MPSPGNRKYSGVLSASQLSNSLTFVAQAQADANSGNYQAMLQDAAAYHSGQASSRGYAGLTLQVAHDVGDGHVANQEVANAIGGNSHYTA